MHKWGMVDSPDCACGQAQTVRHVAQECPLLRFGGGIDGLHEALEEAEEWIKNIDSRLWTNI